MKKMTDTPANYSMVWENQAEKALHNDEAIPSKRELNQWLKSVKFLLEED